MKEVKRRKIIVPEPKKRDVILGWIAFGAILTIGIMVAYIFWQIYFPPKILEITKIPVPIAPLPIYSGKEVTIELSYCKYEKIEPITVETFLDGPYYIQTFSSIGDLPEGCYKNKKIKIIIPLSTPAGIYHLKFVHEYRVSFLQEIIIDYQSAPFKVQTPPALKELIQ